MGWCVWLGPGAPKGAAWHRARDRASLRPSPRDLAGTRGPGGAWLTHLPRAAERGFVEGAILSPSLK